MSENSEGAHLKEGEDLVNDVVVALIEEEMG